MKKWIMDNLKVVIPAAIFLISGTATGTWAVAKYMQAEALHEMDQDSRIAEGKQSRLLQTLEWLDEQLQYYEDVYSCPDGAACTGTRKRKYDEYQKRRQKIWEAVQKMGGA